LEDLLLQRSVEIEFYRELTPCPLSLKKREGVCGEGQVSRAGSKIENASLMAFLSHT